MRLVSAEMLMKNDPAKYLDCLTAELDEAKRKNQTPLYNGSLKIIGETKTGNMENIARTLLKSSGVENPMPWTLRLTTAFQASPRIYNPLPVTKTRAAPARPTGRWRSWG